MRCGISPRRVPLRTCGVASLAAILALTGCGGGAGSGGAQPAPTAAAIGMRTGKPSVLGSAARKVKKRPSLADGTIDGSAYVVVRARSLLAAGTDGRGVLVSADAGAHWRAMNTGLPSGATAVAMAARPDDGRLLAVVSGAVYAATPSLPLRWTRWGGNLPRGSTPESIAFSPVTGAVLVGDGGGHLYATTGTSGPWRATEHGLPVGQQAVTVLFATDHAIYAGLTNGLAASRDGAHWTIEEALRGHQITGIARLSRSRLAVSMDTDGLAIQRNDGTWRIITSAALGLPARARVLSIGYDAGGKRLVVGTLIDGLRVVPGLAPPARPFGGVPRGDPVNGLHFDGPWLFAATNSGVIRMPVRGGSG